MGDVGAAARITWIEGYVKKSSSRPVRVVCTTVALQLDTRCNTEDDVISGRTQIPAAIHRDMDVRWYRTGEVSEFGYCLTVASKIVLSIFSRAARMLSAAFMPLASS